MHRPRLAYSLLLLLLSCGLFAQKNERKDSLVRLLGCNVLQQVEENGESFRKAIGKARFEHNSTLLLCDTALWNVSESTIRAIGNVKIIQNRTVLSSDNLIYHIDDNLAEFRGTLVQLQDKDKNTLRTRNLDYNTKDSVATFTRGGAFRDKDGQIIESTEGSYDSKIKTFHFFWNVNMYTDSVFVKTKSLDYNTGTSVAVFGENTHAWRDDNMLSAQGGSYDRGREVFTFIKDVHVMTPSQEAWADTLVYYRAPGDAELFGHAELLDTTRDVAAVAGYMQYIDSLKCIRMTRDAAVIAVTEQGGARDTVHVGADTFIYWTLPKCEIPEYEIAKSKARLRELSVDPITEYRRKAFEDAKAEAEAAKKRMAAGDPTSGILDPSMAPPAGVSRGPILPAPPDLVPEWMQDFPQIPDSLNIQQPPDSLSTAGGSVPDSLSVSEPDAPIGPLDSTRIGFLQGIGNVKVFRKDMQAACDSLAYTDLDSLVRLYRRPVVWNEVRRQYSADSITVILKDRALDRASLMSDAFIIVQEDSILFDQIRGAEMMAYFDSTGALKRFDSMGGSSGVFFIEEKGSLATVNKFEAKMLSATFKDGALNDLSYFEDVKSDAYPVVQLQKDERILKGFEWQPERRPKGPEDITSFTPREPERDKYEAVPHCAFAQTDEYFPGHIESVLEQLREQKARKEERKRLQKERQAAPDSLAPLPDSLSVEDPDSIISNPTDSLAINAPDSLSGGVADSLAVRRADSFAVSTPDSLSTQTPDSLMVPSAKDLRSLIPKDPKEEQRALEKARKEAKMAEKESLRARKDSIKAARWADLDARDADRAARKAEKALRKQRQKTMKALRQREKQEAKERRTLERYIRKYEKKKAKEEARAARKAAASKASK